MESPDAVSIAKMRGYVKRHAAKLDDTREAERTEANQKERGKLQIKLKKLETDEKFLEFSEKLRQLDLKEQQEARAADLGIGEGPESKTAEGDVRPENGLLWYPRKPESNLPEVLQYRAGLPVVDEGGRRPASVPFFVEGLRCFGRKPNSEFEDPEEAATLKDLSDEDLTHLLRTGLNGSARAQKDALIKFVASASTLGPRRVLLQGDPSNFDTILELAFGKKGSEGGRNNALIALKGLAWTTPLMIGKPLEDLLALQIDGKLGKAASEAATAVMSKFTPSGHGVCQLLLPTVVALVEDKNWKVRLAGLKLLSPCLQQLRHTANQLSDVLSRLLPQLLEGPLMEPRQDVQSAARDVLAVIAKMVRNSEVSRLSADVVLALADPANQKNTQDVLSKLGSTTFMNYIDAPSLALLVPIMTRGLKEREQKSRKWSAQILGASVMLVKDSEYLRPYMPVLLPLLKECVVDPTYEIQREAAKCFGMLTQELADYSRAHLQPWLCVEISSKDPGVSLGCAHALSEVLLKMDKRKRDEWMLAVEVGARGSVACERSGYLNLLDYLPQALKGEFAKYIQLTFPAMLAGVLPETDDPGMRASQSLIARFANICPDHLLPGLEDLFFACQHDIFVFPTAVKHQGVYICKDVHWQMREIYIRLLQQLCEKILEHRKYGQDMLTCEECSTRKVREDIMALLVVMREDPNAQVSRQAKHIYRICGGGPKTPREISQTLETRLLRMRQDPKCSMKRKAAENVLASLLEAGELIVDNPEEYLAKLPAPPALEAIPDVEATQEGPSALAKLLAGTAGEKNPDNDIGIDEGDAAGGAEERQSRARAAFSSAFPSGSWNIAGRGGEQARVLCENIAASVAIEALSGRGLFGELRSRVQAVASQYVEGAVDTAAITSAALSVAKAVFGQSTLADEEAEDETPAETLLRVDDLMLMYGGGHLLLKDTLLEIRKGHRYGVVGHNGCGKTTLMRELQAGRIAGMPKELRCVHVSDADLGNMKVLEMSAISFVKRDLAKVAAVSADEALMGVGFPKEMQDKAVSDLSGGWRMRLILAVAMMKQADILLLDEPTNHLDVHAVKWLCQYLLSLTTGALMVISHDPHFLNAVCTDIIQYRDKKLVHYKGNFDNFKQANQISDDDADALLAGNLKLDTQTSNSQGNATEGDPADASDEAATGAATISPGTLDGFEEPKTAPAKLVFPIPGKLEGIRTNSKPVMEMKDVYFEYEGGKGQIIKGVTTRLTLGTRVAIVGVNGAGKSTLLNLMCGELRPSEHDGKVGEVWQHHNLRLAYIAQHHMTTLGKWYESTPFTYLSFRFQNGWDEEAQRHLMDPKDEEEAQSRREKAAIHGKYGREVGSIVGRNKVTGKLVYEVQWKGMDDAKQNTFETLAKLRQLGVEGHATACDLRLAATSGGIDQRPCSRREIVKHLEQFGIDEEMCCNRQIGGFSAGQKSKLALACAVWTKPHLLALDEPTNYLDQETVESLARALRNFRGGVIVVTHSRDFIEKVCEDEWLVADGKVTVSKLKKVNGADKDEV